MMQEQVNRAALLAAIAQGTSMTSLPFTLAGEMPEPLRNGSEERQPGRLARFARSAARHPIRTGRTCVHAAKLLPTVRHALPWYVWPVLALAAAVKCLPLDFGTDETLFALAALLILWQRPGLLEALYHEAASGKPARCECERHTRKAAAR